MPRRTRWFGARPKPAPTRAAGGASFPSTLPALPGYAGKACGGRHGAISYVQTRSDGHGHRVCPYCRERVYGVLPPAKDRGVNRLLDRIQASARAGNASARAKRDRTGRRWHRDELGRFAKKGGR